jgi:hypothetical protein
VERGGAVTVHDDGGGGCGYPSVQSSCTIVSFRASKAVSEALDRLSEQRLRHSFLFCFVFDVHGNVSMMRSVCAILMWPSPVTVQYVPGIVPGTCLERFGLTGETQGKMGAS